MWPLVVWLLLFPLSLPLADWVTHQMGQERRTTPAALRAALVLYLVVATVLAVHGFTG